MILNQYEISGGGIITIPHPKSYRDCVQLIISDYYRIKGVRKSLLHIFIRMMIPYGNSFLFWFRLSQYKGWLYPLSKILLARSSRLHHIQIPSTVKVGWGFYIGHGIDMVVNPTTIIGNNVNLSPFLNIGTNQGNAAIIGDNVYVGPNVCIVGNVTLGNCSTIGAGAVVVKDVGENETVAGTPARALHKNTPGRYVNRRWPINNK